MPQMVAIFNGAGGGAAALVALSEFLTATAGGAGADLCRPFHDCHPAGRGHRFGLVDRLGHRLRQAPGIRGSAPGDLPRVALRRRRDPGRAAGPRRGAGLLHQRRDPVPRLRGPRPAGRGADRDAHRRGGHAGRHQPAELVHRHRGGGHRLRPGQLRAADRRHPGRRVGRDPHPAHVPGHEPLASSTSCSGRSGPAAARPWPGTPGEQTVRDDQRRGRRGADGLRQERDHRPRLRDGRGPGAADRSAS